MFACLVGGAYALSRNLASTFLPVEDQGYFFVVALLPDGASLQRMDAVALQARDILQATPGGEIAGFISGLNFLTNAAQSNSAVEFALLKPWDERGPEQSASALVSAVRPKLLALPDAFALSFDPPSVNGLGTTGGFEFQVEDLTGRGSAALNGATQALLGVARQQPELNPQSLFSAFAAATPPSFYDLDRTMAKLPGLSLPDAFNTLQINLGSLHVNDLNLFGHSFRGTLQAGKVGPATGALDTLVQLDPVYVTLNPSETELAEIEKARAAGKLTAEVSTPGEASLTRAGELTFLDNVIDRSTATIVARVTLQNQDFARLPGRYVSVRLLIREEADALMAPAAALGSGQRGKFVHVVGAGDKAEMRSWSLGAPTAPWSASRRA